MQVTDDGYAAMFERAAGFPPHDYQRRIGESERLPDVIDVPTGLGKTAAIVLAWLWHWLHPHRQAARHLVIALPMRTLVQQTADRIRSWLANLGLNDEIDLVVLMGGTPRSIANGWRANPERPTILIGTIDVVVSKILVRGYGTARHAYPMDAGLTWNDTHLVIDETQLAAASTRTLRQVNAFQRLISPGPFGTVGLTCMSATIDSRLLDTVDNPVSGAASVRLSEADDDEDIRRRRAAKRMIRATDLDVQKPRDIADHVVTHHRPGTLTLVIVNTVVTAREVHAALQKATTSVGVVLLHSRFRPVDRDPLVAQAVSSDLPGAGRIVVSTQVVEAGVDVDAALLVTEASPWASFIQRVGRCNRAGKLTDAEVHWVKAGRRSPYGLDELSAAQQALDSLEGRAVTSIELLGKDIPAADRLPSTLRRADFLSLFDTAPDLTGNDLDIAPYIRESDDLDVYLAWSDWTGPRPPADLELPAHEWRCAVSIAEARDYQKGGAVLWRRDPRERTWSSGGMVRPGETLLVHASHGWYNPATGFDGKAAGPVPVADEAVAPNGDPETETPNAADDLAFGCATWIPLDQHLLETEEEARAIVARTALQLDLAADVILAARLHDVGKAHPTWQDALCDTADDDEVETVDEGRPWAKSTNKRRPRLRTSSGQTIVFRHEFASVLALQTSFAALLTSAHDPELVLYLVLAHHGKLRVTVRELGDHPDDHLLGVPDGEQPDLPAVLGIQADPGSESSIRQFGLDGDPDRGLPAWTDTVRSLLDRYGPFRLAYLETLVRAADWRASARHGGGNRP